MNIDEWLNKWTRVKRNYDAATIKLKKAEHRASRPRSPGNFDADFTTARDPHARENLLIKYATTAKEWRIVRAQYIRMRDTLTGAIDYLLFWEGSVISRIWLYNLYFDRDPLDGVNEILRTDDPQEIQAKINTAKAHLADLLRAQGVRIER